MSGGTLPKVVLHDHLDGGLRPRTVLELAAQIGYSGLPAWEPDSLAAWFRQGKGVSLVQYLEAFDQTLAVMQTPNALERVAYEAGSDLAQDGVVYAEVRLAPSLSTREGLSLEAVIESVLAGLSAASLDHAIELRMIVDGMRQEDNTEEIARVAVSFREAGVVGFDIAGPEVGYPATDHATAFHIASEGGLGITIHAGEAYGPASIAAALDVGAQRIGHGVRVIEDCVVREGVITEMGVVAQRVHENRIPLEVCPRSNLQTIGWAPEDHPVGLLHRAGFVVTISPDNRLMSGVMPSDEFDYLAEIHGFTLDDLAQITENAMEAAFCTEEVKQRVWSELIEPGYKEARTNSTMS